MALAAQFGLLAQGTGFEDWANILFILVLAILWLLAGLIKAISKKAPPRAPREPEDTSRERGRAGESWHERLRRKAEEMQRRIEEEAGLREPGEATPPARPASPRPSQSPGGTITIRSDSEGESVMVYEPAQPATERERQAARQREARQAVASAGQYAAKQVSPVELPTTVSVPKFEPIMGTLSGAMAEPPKPLEPGEMPRDLMHEPAGFEVAALIDYSDPDALKKAILHYEILGRPLALRETPDQTSPF